MFKCFTPKKCFQREKGSNHLDRERFKGNNRDAFIDSHDYEMLLQDNDEVSETNSVVKMLVFV